MNNINKIYFGGLNELRAIAALSVVIHHIEQFKGMNGFTILNKNISFLIHNLGKASVDLFFVLSGFLISYLLLQEKNNNNGHINIGKFYLRRIFRIWPLYYLILLISFVLIPLLSNFSIFEYNKSLLNLVNDPDNYSFKTIAQYLFFLPQFSRVVLGASQSWSIGVEEQFYLLMPLVLTIFNRKIFFIFILIGSLMYLGITIEINRWFDYLTIITKVLKYIKFQFMLIGVIGGYLYFYNSRTIDSKTKSKFVYILLVMLIVCLSVFAFFENKINHFILGILFLFLILFTINDSNSLVLKNRQLSYLGKVSYGIYMYHCFILFLVFPFANKYFAINNTSYLTYNVFLYGTSIILTILLSIVSYEFFESKFIKIKDLKYKV
jgi:peptidoglycan/LPS O-acetylase OafA/YrhL